MTDEQVQSMLRAIEHAAETLNREGYEIPYGEPTQSALDVRFLLAHITVKNADLAAARADVVRLRKALGIIVASAPDHSNACDCDSCQFSRIAGNALAVTIKP